MPSPSLRPAEFQPIPAEPESPVSAVARPAAATGALGEVAGDSASPQAIRRLKGAVKGVKARAAVPLLQRALACVSRDEDREGAALALKALNLDEDSGLGWYVLAICLEKTGEFTRSLQCYERALQLIPEYEEIANDLGRLAYRLEMIDQAEKLFAWYFVRNPGSPDAANNLACVLRDRGRFEEAVEVLRPAILAAPTNAMLWNTLGTVLYEQGEMEQALTFLNEAVASDAGFAKARYNRANARLSAGDTAGAVEDVDEAIARARAPGDLAMMRLARSTMLAAAGELGRGWDAYEARLDAHYADATHYAVPGQRWSPEHDLRGRTLLVVGEQGLGDEILFGSLLPEVLEALGPYGRLVLAVERRLVPLFARSFPQAEVGAHATVQVGHRVLRTAPFLDDTAPPDLWTPIASLLRRFRRSVTAFPDRSSFLTADRGRKQHWSGVMALAGPRPKVGLLWKSMKQASARFRYYSPFDAWEPVLRRPGVTFVNLQYGDCAAEIEQARVRFGVTILQPPGIDLKQDQDDLAALCGAMDLVIGPANAATNIAAAVGAPLWLITTPGAWPRLGTDHYPWYPQARVFAAPAYNDWAPVMAEIAGELAGAF